MAKSDDLDGLPLPGSWPALAKRAILHAISMASAAFVVHLERWANVLSPRRRPHYTPADRLAVLELGAARGWSAAETARRFLVEVSPDKPVTVPA